MRTKNLLGWTLVAALVGFGCGGGAAESTAVDSQGEHAHGEHAHGEHVEGQHEHHGDEGEEHGDLPPTVQAFHSAMAPVWHSEEGASRAALACENAGTFTERADAVRTSPVPEGVGEAGWADATAALSSAVAELIADCDAGGPEAEAKLSVVHDAFHAIVDHLRADR